MTSLLYSVEVEKEKISVPPVRLELTTFRLWDWRAADCAKEAPCCLPFQTLLLTLSNGIHVMYQEPIMSRSFQLSILVWNGKGTAAKVVPYLEASIVCQHLKCEHWFMNTIITWSVATVVLPHLSQAFTSLLIVPTIDRFVINTDMNQLVKIQHFSLSTNLNPWWCLV